MENQWPPRARPDMTPLLLFQKICDTPTRRAVLNISALTPWTFKENIFVFISFCCHGNQNHACYILLWIILKGDYPRYISVKFWWYWLSGILAKTAERLWSGLPKYICNWLMQNVFSSKQCTYEMLIWFCTESPQNMNFALLIHSNLNVWKCVEEVNFTENIKKNDSDKNTC
jgi:hypothetical protein